MFFTSFLHPIVLLCPVITAAVAPSMFNKAPDLRQTAYGGYVEGITMRNIHANSLWEMDRRTVSRSTL